MLYAGLIFTLFKKRFLFFYQHVYAHFTIKWTKLFAFAAFVLWHSFQLHCTGNSKAMLDVEIECFDINVGKGYLFWFYILSLLVYSLPAVLNRFYLPTVSFKLFWFSLPPVVVDIIIHFIIGFCIFNPFNYEVWI